MAKDMSAEDFEKAHIKEQIKGLEKTIKKEKETLKYAEKCIYYEQDYLEYRDPFPYPRAVSNTVVLNGQKAYSRFSTPEEMADAQDALTRVAPNDFNTLLGFVKEYTTAQDNIKMAETSIENYKLDLKKLEKEKPQKKVTEKDIPDGQGHLYPVATVAACQKKLDHWNKVLDDFIEKLENTTFNINITWYLKKIEWVCRKINYALAMVRYEIIKALSPLYKKVQESLPILQAVGGGAVTDPISAVSFCKNVIDFFLKPYMVLIQFITDFMKYTPPLVTSTASLVGKAAIIPPLALSRINLVADDKADGKQKQLAEVYKQYIDVHMDPITLADLQGGNPTKPAIAEFSPNKEQYQILTKQLNVVNEKIDTLWEDFKKKLHDSYNESLSVISVRYPEKFNILSKDEYKIYYVDGQYKKYLEQEETAYLVYEIADAEKKAQIRKEKAISKAEKAQKATAKYTKATSKKEKYAEMMKHMSEQEILDNDLRRKYAEAQAEAEKAKVEEEKAKADANKAKEDAENINTNVDIPWDTNFNSVKYPVYADITPELLANKLYEGNHLFENLYPHIKSYYLSIFNPDASAKSTAKAAKKDDEYVDFLRNFADVYPFILDLFMDVKDLVIEQHNLTKQIKSLNRRSIFT